MTTRDQDDALVAERWNENVAGSDAFGRDVFWLAVPEVQARYQRRGCAGGNHGTWARYVVETFLRPRGLDHGRVLSMGCGSGALERELAQLRMFSSCDGIDVADGALAIAREEAAKAGIDGLRYAVRDVRREPLERGVYDAVFFNGSLHHIDALEVVLDEVRASLVSGGLLVINEYVGARHFDFPDKQRRAISTAFAMLPPRYRRSFAAGSYGREVCEAPLPDWREVKRVDPSEAVRSNEILPAIGERFDVIVRNDCGGSILQFLLSGLAGNFRHDDPPSMRMLDALMAYEDALVDSGELDSDFVVLVASPRR